MRHIWGKRLLSTLLVASMTSACFVMPTIPVYADETDSAAVAAQTGATEQTVTMNDETQISGTDDLASVVEQYLNEQLGVQGTLITDEESVDAGTAIGNDEETAAGSGTTSAEETPDGLDLSMTVTDVETTEDGKVTVTDDQGKVVTIDETNRTIDVSGTGTTQNDESLVHNVNDAAAYDEYEYLGTGSETGAAHYRMSYDADDAAEILDAAEREEAEDAAFLEWYYSDSISYEEIQKALQEAAAYDQYVLEEYWEPVYENTEDDEVTEEPVREVIEAPATKEESPVEETADQEETVTNIEYYTNTQVETRDVTAQEETDPKVPAAKEETPVAKEETPAAKEETSVEEPATKEETPVTKEEPVMKQETLEAKEETPVTKKEIPATKEETPVEEPAAKEETPATKEETSGSEAVRYRLKDEYANERFESEYVTFGTTSDANNANEDDIMLLEANGDDTTPGYQSTSIYIVDKSKAIIRVVDATTHKGIAGASVSVMMGKNSSLTTAITAISEEDHQKAGIVQVDTDPTQTQVDAFVNISAPGYRGITRVCENLAGSSVLTYELFPATDGEVYLRGVSLDGIDVYETNYTLYISPKNISKYNIIAFVDKAGSDLSELPSQLSLTAGGKTKQTASRQTDTSHGSSYATYTFYDQWSLYDKKDPILKPGDQIALQFDDGTAWVDGNAAHRNQRSLKITVSLPVSKDTGTMNWKLSLTPSDGLSTSMPKGLPLEGSKISLDALGFLPVYLRVSLDGTIIFGYSDSKKGKELQKAFEGLGDPATESPSQQAKDNIVSDRFWKNFYSPDKKFDDTMDVLDAAKAAGKSFKFIGDGKVKLSYSVVGEVHYRKRGGYYSGTIKGSLAITGKYTATWYLTVVPIYFGACISAKAEMDAAIGVQAPNIKKLDLSQISMSDDSGLALLLAVAIEPFVGFGVRGALGFEVDGKVELDLLFNLIGKNTIDDKHYPRARGYLSGRVGGSIYFMVGHIDITVWKDSYRLFDSWKVHDPSDTKLPSDLTYLAKPKGNERRLAPSVLIANNELREAVSNAATQDYGIYTGQGSKDSAEIEIAANGTQNVLKEFQDLDVTSTDSNGEEQLSLSNIVASQQMTYVTCKEQGRYLRIANVVDNQNYGGKVVPRVTIMTATEQGLIGSQIALPASVDKDGNVYGYDYNFGVYMADDETTYVAIVSTSVDPSTATLDDVARNSRLRLVVLRGEKVVANRVLGKTRYNDSTDYLYTGAPVVYGNKDYAVGDIGGYTVACSITTDLDSLVRAMNDPEKEGSKVSAGDALYAATNMPYGMVYDQPLDIIIPGDGHGYESLQIVLPDDSESGFDFLNAPVLVYTERENNTSLQAVTVINRLNTINYELENPIELYGEIHNLQHANERVGDTLYCTSNGRLYSVRYERPDGMHSIGGRMRTTKVEYPATASDGEDVILPTSDGLQIVEADGIVYLVACYPQQGDAQADGTYAADTAISVYTMISPSEGTYVIGGPRETILKNRSVFNAACAFIRKKGTANNYILRMLYLADKDSQTIKVPTGSITSADQYTMGICNEICNLYMWELHLGRSAELTALEGDAYFVSRNDKYVTLVAEVQNTCVLPLQTITVAVTTDTSNAAGQGDRKDIEVPLRHIANGQESYILYPGSKATVQIKVPMNSGWSGKTTLYAAVVQVDGQSLSQGNQAVWVNAGQLLNNGDFSISVEEDGIGGDPYAAVRVENHSATPFSNVAIDVEVNYYTNDADTWTPLTRYELGSHVNGSATGYDDRIATINIPLSEQWNDRNVYAVRFTLVSTSGDVTLNNAYRISDALLRPEHPTEEWILVYAESEDSTMGSVSISQSYDEDAEPDELGGTYERAGTEVTLTATPEEGYEFDHWEVYDYITDDWEEVPEHTSPTLTFQAGYSIAGTRLGGDDAVYVMACYRSDGSTRVLLMGMQKVTTTDSSGNTVTEYQDGALNTLLDISENNTDAGEVTHVSSPVAGAQAYRLTDGAWLGVQMDYDGMEWLSDGWYAFTYDSYGNVKLGDHVSDPTMISHNADVAEYCYAAVFYENTGVVHRVLLDAGGGTLPEAYRDMECQWVRTSEIDLEACSHMTREGYMFLGWYKADGTQVTDLGQLTDPQTSLFARWQSNSAGGDDSGSGSGGSGGGTGDSGSGSGGSDSGATGGGGTGSSGSASTGNAGTATAGTGASASTGTVAGTSTGADAAAGAGNTAALTDANGNPIDGIQIMDGTTAAQESSTADAAGQDPATGAIGANADGDGNYIAATGDDGHMELWLLLMLVSSLALATRHARRRYRR